jgi:hypothetical protein
VRGQSELDRPVLFVSKAIQDLLRDAAVELAPDMGQGSREQGFAEAPKRVRFILSEQPPDHNRQGAVTE